ncbi:MAG: sigma-70 family RNA polymerase sigma factor [Magnetococcales bacterium]|nr:sigma-70 family RNA polymerase sigma factor [Magnetococcales bacterium]
MESRNHYQGIHPYAVRTVRHHAWRLARSDRFHPADLEDIEQELMLDLHRRFSRFDASKADVTTFIARVVANHAASMCEATGWDRHSATGTLSLNEVIQDRDGDSVERIDTISDSQSPWHTQALPWQEVIELRTDISRLMGRLPPSLRNIAERLKETTVSELSASAGIPRHRLYDALGKIRNRLTQTGSRKKSPTDSKSHRYVRGMEQWTTAPA